MRLLILQAFVYLIRHDLFLVRHDFAALHANVRAFPLASRTTQSGDVEEICRAVAYACIWYPKQVLCLQRSSVAVALLRKYGIRSEMSIGVQRVPFKAHAWVEVDSHVVNDKPEVQSEYLVLERC